MVDAASSVERTGKLSITNASSDSCRPGVTPISSAAFQRLRGNVMFRHHRSANISRISSYRKPVVIEFEAYRCSECRKITLSRHGTKSAERLF
jgi:hypothetical protein